MEHQSIYRDFLSLQIPLEKFNKQISNYNLPKAISSYCEICSINPDNYTWKFDMSHIESATFINGYYKEYDTIYLCFPSYQYGIRLNKDTKFSAKNIKRLVDNATIFLILNKLGSRQTDIYFLLYACLVLLHKHYMTRGHKDCKYKSDLKINEFMYLCYRNFRIRTNPKQSMFDTLKENFKSIATEDGHGNYILTVGSASNGKKSVITKYIKNNYKERDRIITGYYNEHLSERKAVAKYKEETGKSIALKSVHLIYTKIKETDSREL